MEATVITEMEAHADNAHVLGDDGS